MELCDAKNSNLVLKAHLAGNIFFMETFLPGGYYEVGGEGFVYQCCACILFNIYISLSVHGIMKFIGLTDQGKDIVFRFIIEYSSLMDFGP